MNKRKIGENFESLTMLYLQSEGYTVLERNFQCKLGEIDIIATKDGYLRFIEVKYRTNNKIGTPEEAVTIKKQRMISKTAAYYMLKKAYSMDSACCFDVVAILDNEIKLYENAFEYCE